MPRAEAGPDPAFNTIFGGKSVSAFRPILSVMSPLNLAVPERTRPVDAHLEQARKSSRLQEKRPTPPRLARLAEFLQLARRNLGGLSLLNLNEGLHRSFSNRSKGRSRHDGAKRG